MKHSQVMRQIILIFDASGDPLNISSLTLNLNLLILHQLLEQLIVLFLVLK